MSTYLRYELLRTFRNGRFFIFSIGFPLILYFLIAGPNRHDHDFFSTGISAPLYYMIGLAAFGAMMSTVGSGARIAGERAAGWNRQLRITPLTSRSYIGAKVVTAYAAAIVSVVLLYAAGTVLGVRLGAGHWLEMTGLILVGLVPFAALGILLGHLLTVDAIGPAMGGIASLLALLGGTWFPITSGALYDIGRFLPSYWLVRASHVSIGGSGWGTRGRLVMAAWSIVLSVLAAHRYRRDTRRV
jgi:ABC-2 type transport system permease protein